MKELPLALLVEPAGDASHAALDKASLLLMFSEKSHGIHEKKEHEEKPSG